MSKMVNCKACGKEIAKGVNKCVHCGKDQRNFFMKHKILTAIGVIVVIGILSSIGGKKTTTTNTTATKAETKQEVKEEPKKEDTKITYENFLNIKMGQSYDEVKALLGEGQEVTSSEVAGIKTVMYKWNGDGMGNVNITFQGNKVTIKAQAFLQDHDAKITMDLYNKIENGMTYDQVKGILGEGELTSETKIMDSGAKMYSYINKGGSNANFTFSNDSMTAKAQFNLK